MQITISLAVILAIFVVYAQTQPSPSPTPGVTPGVTPGPGGATCPNAPRNATCRGRALVGRGGAGCVAGQRFAFNMQTRACTAFQYRGCGGNNNRHCTEQACQAACVRT